MKRMLQFAGLGALGIIALGTLATPRARAQDPILTPIIVSEAAPIIVSAVKPKPKPTGTVKLRTDTLFPYTTLFRSRARGNDLAIQTFTLSQPVAAKMQQIVDKGGYQYGDKITVYYDAQTHQALKIKGKPSRPL